MTGSVSVSNNRNAVVIRGRQTRMGNHGSTTGNVGNANNVLSGRLLVYWMSQTTRCQAFILLSCAVILVESFLVGHHPHSHDVYHQFPYWYRTVIAGGGGEGVGRLGPTGTSSSSSRPSIQRLSFHRGESAADDQSWNNTAMAMNEAMASYASWLSMNPETIQDPIDIEKDIAILGEATTTTTTSFDADSTSAIVETTSSSENTPPPPPFEYRVSHDTVDYWFHVLGGREEEDIVARRHLANKRGGPGIVQNILNRGKDHNGPASSAPASTPNSKTTGTTNNTNPNTRWMKKGGGSSEGGDDGDPKSTDHWMLP